MPTVGANRAHPACMGLACTFPADDFSTLQRALPRFQFYRGSRGRRPIRHDRFGSSFLFRRQVDTTLSVAYAVARARADGYTLLLGGTISHINEVLLKSRPLYDPIKDLDPISCMVVYALAIAINPSLPAQTLKELITYAKANPGKLTYGHNGVGSTNYLTGELFRSLAGNLEIVPVPYRGSGPVIADLISGHVSIGVVGVTGQVLEFHRSGKLRVLAVTSPTRLAGAPDLPTAAEAGLPGFISTGSGGLLAPAGTPRPIIDQIAQATHTALAEPAYQQMLIDAGLEPTPDSSPEKFRRMLADDIALWTPVVTTLGLKID